MKNKNCREKKFKLIIGKLLMLKVIGKQHLLVK